MSEVRQFLSRNGAYVVVANEVRQFLSRNGACVVVMSEVRREMVRVLLL